MRRIYFDYAASTPMHPLVQKTMRRCDTQAYANASAAHGPGRMAAAIIDAARQEIAWLISCKPQEIIFTSGATESCNLALMGLLAPGDHCIVGPLEHAAIAEPAGALERRGVAITRLPCAIDGAIDFENVREVITDQTKMISVQWVNNEIGVVQEMQKLFAIIAEINQDRLRRGLNKIYIHSDASQAGAYFELNAATMPFDLLTLSAHKMFGPKGIGALFVRAGVPLRPMYYGGGQQYGLRPGTLPTALIAGFGAAALYVRKNREVLYAKVTNLRQLLFLTLQDRIPTFHATSVAIVAPHILHGAIPGIDYEVALIALDRAGISVAAGAACAAGAIEPSRVLTAIGYDVKLQHSVLRFSIGPFLTQRDIIIGGRRCADVLMALLHR